MAREYCPECEAQGIKKGYQGTFAKAHLGRHRFFAHGIEGKSSGAKKRAEARQEPTAPAMENNNEPGQEVQNAAAFASGKCDAVIQDTAARAGLPYPVIASIVSEYLHRSTGGKILGTRNRVSALPRKAA